MSKLSLAYHERGELWSDVYGIAAHRAKVAPSNKTSQTSAQALTKRSFTMRWCVRVRRVELTLQRWCSNLLAQC